MWKEKSPNMAVNICYRLKYSVLFIVFSYDLPSAIGMILWSVRLSLCLSVTKFFVVKRYILQLKCLDKLIGSVPEQHGFTTFYPYTDPVPQTPHLLNRKKCCHLASTKQFCTISFFSAIADFLVVLLTATT